MRIHTNLKRLLLGAAGLLAIGGGAMLLPAQLSSLEHEPFIGGEEEEEGYGGPGKAREWRLLAWRDENGLIPRDGLAKATEQIRQLSYRTTRSHGTSGWQERGPTNVAGRTRCLLIDPRNPNKMFMGSVSGGIWVSHNGGANWAPVNDRMPNLAINCMAFDPSNPDVIYAGTGEGFFSGDSIGGMGIFKSYDGGVTWNLLEATKTLGNVDRIAVSPTNPSIILAGFQGDMSLGANGAKGIYRSVDGGATWNKVKAGQTGFQVAFHPTDGNLAISSILEYDFSIGAWYAQLAYSTDAGATWTNSTGGRYNANDARIEFAYAPSNPNIVYAHIGTGGGKVWKSTDGGKSFISVSVTAMNEAQHWHNNMVWVDPTNPNVLVVGAVRLWRSTDGGVNFTMISTGGGPLRDFVHSDVHSAVSHPGYNGMTNRTVFIGGDGGFFRTDDIYSASTTEGWLRFTRDARTAQFYGVAGHGPSGAIIGGTQDNGTLLLETGTSEAVFRGPNSDGGFCAMEPNDPTVFYGASPFMGVFRYIGPDGAHIIQNLPEFTAKTSNFISPFALDPNNVNRLVVGGMQLWRTTNPKAPTPSSVTWSSIKGSVGSPISAIAIAPTNSDTIWIGHNNGQIYKTSNGTAATPIWTAVDNNGFVNPLPNRYVTRILIDPADATKVFVAFGGFAANNLQVTTNGGSTWTSASGSGVNALPSAPVRAISRHPEEPNLLHAGTEVGICESADGGATWTAPSKGPLNVSVDELTYMSGSSRLLAATYGRGIWTYGPLVVQSISAPAQMTAGDTAQVVLTLDGIAGGAGVQVALSSSSTALSTPSSVTIPAGEMQATFTVTANTVTTNTPVTLSASIGGNTKSAAITVVPDGPITLSSVSVSPTVVPGGSAKVVKFKVNLKAPAPAGGIKVNLSSSNPSVAGMPSSLTIPEGGLTRSVTVSHASVPTNTSVQLTAKYNSDVLSAPLMVEAPKPLSVVNAPTSVYGGTSTVVTSTVTLNAPAPEGGTVVELGSSNTTAAVPSAPTITVPGGATSASFTVNHFPVPVLRNVGIKATANGVLKSGALAVKPPALIVLSFTPGTTTGGGSTIVTGTVKINAPAPSAGAKIVLSDDSAAAVTPASVTIPSGATDATFNITHAPVATNTVVTVTGTYNGTKTDTLTLLPPRVSTFGLSRTSVKGGSSTVVTGTVTLNVPAPAGGLVVNLSSSNSGVASVPATIAVPAGATSTTFTVNHSVVGSQMVVTLTAGGGGSTLTKTLTVNP